MCPFFKIKKSASSLHPSHHELNPSFLASTVRWQCKISTAPLWISFLLEQLKIF